jgi:pyrimidine operon attenuation protein/uracil phosphoribosyltransferase
MKHQAIEKKLAELTAAVISSESGGRIDNMVIIGIRTGGELLARELQERIEKKLGKRPLLGMLDITLYRDDLDYKDGLKQPEIRATDVPFSIDGKRVLLVDDVLFTGRTIRAALDALCDLGRPSKIELLVLIDRGFRELPIRPDYVGSYLETAHDDRVQVIFDDKKGWSVKISHGT